MLRKVGFRVANRDLTARIDRGGDWYVALCLEVDVASQGKSAEEALTNLSEAVELYFEVV
jgi:predicted RNase H-like HicB family nuclease